MSKQKIFRMAIILLMTVIFLAVLMLYTRDRFNVNFPSRVSQFSLDEIQTQPGFIVSVFAEDLSGPRLIAFGPDGVLYVAERGEGRIIKLPDADSDGLADGVEVFAENLNAPHSLVFHEGSWYVGSVEGIYRVTDVDQDGFGEDIDLVVPKNSDGQHNTRTILFDSKGRMVLSLGSSCNVCEEEDPRRAAITVFDNGNGAGERVFATGLRNAVGLALHPITGQIWATNNGRDLMGDELPPETIYIIQDGEDYGWPYCHSGRIEDPEFGFQGACEQVAGPIVEMQAHSAPLGLVFYTGENFPQEYQGDLFVAFHGSWNRSEPTGYKVIRIPILADLTVGNAQDFVWGWLGDENQISGRPVGLAIGPDGALYISDDYEGRIFRVIFQD